MQNMKEGIKAERIKVSSKFVTALSIVSIIGFSGIISQTIFNKDINLYIEALWMMVIGVGLMFEAKIKMLRTVAHGLDSNNFSHLTTVVVGVIAMIAGVFSFPSFKIDNPSFLAIKGIIAIIAIIVIIIQTWIIDIHDPEKVKIEDQK